MLGALQHGFCCGSALLRVWLLLSNFALGNVMRVSFWLSLFLGVLVSVAPLVFLFGCNMRASNPSDEVRSFVGFPTGPTE